MAAVLATASLGRRHLAAAILAVGLLTVILGQPVVVACAASALAATAVMPDRRTRSSWMPDLLAWLPIGLATALCAGIVVVVLGGVAGVPLWGGPAGAVSTAVVLSAFAGAAFVRGGRVALWSTGSAVAWLPGALIAGTAAFRFAQPMSYWSRPVWAVTDWMNHAEMVVDLLAARTLDYDPASSSGGWARTVYPRGLHAVLAWLAGDASSASATWQRAIEAVSVAVAAVTTAAVVLAALLAWHAARRMGTRAWAAAVAALGAALLMLHPGIHLPMASAGFVTTTVATLVVFAVVAVAANGPVAAVGSRRVVLLALLAFGVFHLWQLLAVPVGLLLGYLAWRWWRSARDRVWLVAAVLVGGACLSLPLALATLGIRNLDGQALNGGFVGMSVVVSGAVAVFALVVAVLNRSSLGALADAMVVMLGSLLVLGLGLVPVSGGTISDFPYYAQKVLWHVGVLGLPLLVAGTVVAVVALLRGAWRRMPGSPAIRGAVLAVPAVLIAAYAVGGLSYGVGLTLRALAAPGGLSPQVPLLVLDVQDRYREQGRPVLPLSLHPQGWGPSFLFTDWHAAQIARSLGAEVPVEGTLTSHRLGSVCAWLRLHPDAVRLTGPMLGYRELLDAGCPAAVVRPDAWLVLTTPPQWWARTAWEATRGERVGPPTVVPDTARN